MSFQSRGKSFLAYITAALALLTLFFPEESFAAAIQGVAIWWDILFPALFPFFVICEIMLGLGIVHFFGTLLDPMMRPLFRIPGSGGFVMAMGFAAGYPVAARLTSGLWDAKLLNREESERLVGFTTTSDPIFLIGAVSVGFFHNAALAPILAVAHYGGAVIVGLLMRFWGKGSMSAPADYKDCGSGSLAARAFESAHRARLSDGRPFGALLLQGIQSGLRLIIVVGGLVVFFSVALKMLSLAGVIGIAQSAAGSALSFFGIAAPLSAAIVNGFFEVTLGAKAAASSYAGADLRSQAAVAAFVLSWAGLSVHAQSMSLMHHMPVRYASFVSARLAHSVIAAMIAYLAWNWLAPVSTAWIPNGAPTAGWEAFKLFTPLSLAIFLSALILIPVLYACFAVIRLALRAIRRITVD